MSPTNPTMKQKIATGRKMLLAPRCIAGSGMWVFIGEAPDGFAGKRCMQEQVPALIPKARLAGTSRCPRHIAIGRIGRQDSSIDNDSEHEHGGSSRHNKPATHSREVLLFLEAKR